MLNLLVLLFICRTFFIFLFALHQYSLYFCNLDSFLFQWVCVFIWLSVYLINAITVNDAPIEEHKSVFEAFSQRPWAPLFSTPLIISNSIYEDLWPSGLLTGSPCTQPTYWGVVLLWGNYRISFNIASLTRTPKYTSILILFTFGCRQSVHRRCDSCLRLRHRRSDVNKSVNRCKILLLNNILPACDSCYRLYICIQHSPARDYPLVVNIH